eukprot:2178167-Pyramimonas_sp.AAC.1
MYISPWEFNDCGFSGPPGSALGGLLGGPGAFLDRLGAILDRLRRFGAFLGRLGCRLRANCVVFGGPWAISAPSWAGSGASWERLGLSWGNIEGLLDRLESREI